MFKFCIWVVVSLPILDLITLAYLNELGANPQEVILRELGNWSLILLLLIFSIPILSKIGLESLKSCRRMLGLWSFFYLNLHVLAFLIFENEFNLRIFLNDLINRPFVTFGFLSFCLLLPLAATSNNFSMKFYGKFWKKIHRLITPAIIFAIIHYFFHREAKGDFSDPTIALIVFLSIWLTKSLMSKLKRKKLISM
tara:strand:+ start:569 stop:1156 length:588 start_codon:yes stop_codon:yes gene_type:complete